MKRLVVVLAAIPVILAAVISTVVVHVVIGAAPIYTTRTFAFVDPVELLASAALGAVCAPIGVGFLRLLSRTDPWWRGLPLPVRPGVGGGRVPAARRRP